MLYLSLPDDQSNSYKIHQEFRIASEVVPGETTKDVTLVAHCTVNKLHLLLPLAERWNGPMSIVVFAPGNDARMTRFAIDGLRQCSTYIRDYATFHLVYPTALLPPFDGGTGELFTEREMEYANFCPEVIPNRIKALSSHSSYDDGYVRATRYIPYPSNLLRNIGRDFAKSTYVFVIDIDMVPNKGLYHELINFLEEKKLFDSIEKNAYVVPAFEINEKRDIPKNKAALREAAARPFYHEVCEKCQRPLNYDRWWKANSNKGVLGPAYTLNWKDPWEPFYIIDSKSPSFDERFKQYGFNRISQACELHLAGYNYVILNNAFVVHQGLKTPHSFHSNKDSQNARNRDLFRKFKKELKEKYPTTDRHC
ncbi:uncharacterized protein TRIADDRAFT_29667 [Trichoplax adhaerens]|uniref:Beta-1,4-glucuronyltransferase 1 n=1 Tax=Trichoplax adhaerens TaxID=10228 RepID=B3S5L0_TRIAD|nr:hypothetical protein TRIADDRAFT_29667 [Trichoplax adhaerens]EDV21862.1 hypothetical protein TRIADDRAFT_29667 [Trichoplax adhaerens]|eukprot:XP_002115499.1 hypothetical protein TRIADDRAFT_29667 [Trichoplax adhaerens]